MQCQALHFHGFRPSSSASATAALSMNALDSDSSGSIFRALQGIRITISRQPRMRQGLFRRVTVLNVVRQQSRHKCHGFIRNIPKEFVGKGVLALNNGCLDGLVVLAIKWWSTTEQHVHNDSETPQIARFRVRLFQDFRGNVVRGSHDPRQPLSAGKVRRKSKINQLEGTPYILARFEDPVLQLEIAMTNASRMQKCNRRQHLHDRLGCKRYS